ncbi:MAG: gamma-glutamylcyclotransferase [Acidobacteria bacterium]|nr:gamma-glutamylcyclotransferase [Acidobacteriota bacterium]
MLYFAYGSNMLTRRIRDPSRAPSAISRGVARAPGFDVRFHKIGQDGSGKCTLVETGADTAAYGVLYEVAEADVERLDRVEGVHTGGYRQRYIEVHPTAGGTTGAITYVAGEGQVDAARLPFDWYRDLCVTGAVEHGLPAHYVEELEGTPAVPDPDAARAAAARRLLDN